MLSHDYVKYEEAENHRSAIMQDFRDNEKKQNLNGRLAATLDFFYNCKICHGLSLCATLDFFYIFMIQLFCIFLNHKIIKN